MTLTRESKLGVKPESSSIIILIIRIITTYPSNHETEILPKVILAILW